MESDKAASLFIWRVFFCFLGSEPFMMDEGGVMEIWRFFLPFFSF